MQLAVRESNSLVRETTQTFVRRSLSLSYDIKEVLEKIERRGFYAAPCVSEVLCAQLSGELAGMPFVSQEPFTITLIEQELSLSEHLSKESLAGQLGKTLGEGLSELFGKARMYPFCSALDFNSVMGQRYPACSIGISPHVDAKKYINLVAAVSVAGFRRFGTCKDMTKTDAVEETLAPGSLLLMKAPGFLGARSTPIHYVRDIQEECTIIMYRQIHEPRAH